MFLFYLEICSIIRIFLTLLISWKYSLNKKFSHLFYIDFISLFFLGYSHSRILDTLSIVLLSGSLYGTINDLLFGWFSPQYWRENHDMEAPFLLLRSNLDNNPRPFMHAFIWGIHATWKYSLVYGLIASIITSLLNISSNEIIKAYTIAFGLLLGLSFEHFSLIRHSVKQEMIPYFVNNFNYRASFILNKFIIIYFLYEFS